VRFPVVRASAEEVPFADGSFDLVFCDHGAMTFADPHATVPEVARILRPGGRLIFNMATPIIWLCWPMDEGPPGRELLRSYFGLGRMVWSETDRSVDWQLTYGAWIRLFRANDLAVEDLIELRPGPEVTTTYQEYATLDWLRDFPGEHIWKVRKEPA
jgi:SAM-dependent methyltransferase